MGKRLKKVFTRFKSRLFLSVFIIPIAAELVFLRKIEEKLILSTVSVWIALLISGILFGRTHCGIMCKAGAIQRFANLLGEGILGRTFTVPHRIERYLRGGKYLFVLILTLWGIIKFKWLIYDGMPLEQYTYLAIALGADGEDFLHYLSVFFLIITIIGTFLVKSFWCKYLCLRGAVLGSLSMISLNKLEVDGASCIHCGICSKICPMSISVFKKNAGRHMDCLGCQQCVAVCPQNAIFNTVFGKKVNPFLLIIMAALVYILVLWVSSLL
ncbi:MAG: 4Fe-4S binding protein [Clostridia bacterium]|nr:4Fe-4S binding protein [Clostridia bacterium]